MREGLGSLWRGRGWWLFEAGTAYFTNLGRRFVMCHLRLYVFCAFLALVSSVKGFAQESVSAYPSRPVTIIIPLSPGGGGDVEARLYNQKLTESLGQPFLNDYKPGAGSTIGIGYVAKAKPDGYTLMAISPTITIVPAFYKDLPFDVNRDFTAISQMSRRSSMLAVTPTFPPTNVAEFLAYAKANPGKVNWGTHGAGSGTHLAAAWMQSITNTKFTFVHYKGSNALTQDLMAGRVHIMVITFTSGLQLSKAGKVRVLGVSNRERSPLMPSIATVQEQGVSDFEYPSWLGIFGPNGMDSLLVSKLNTELVKAERHPDVVKSLATSGTISIGSSSDFLKQVVAVETARWKKIVEESDIKLDE